MTDPLLNGPLWFVGCGNMGQSMLDGWVAAGLDPARFSIIRPSGREVGHGIRVTSDYPEDEVPAIVLLAMKPYQLDLVAPLLAPILDPRTMLVSILAGTELDSLRARFETPRNIVRAMPNLPVRLGRGVVGLYSDSCDNEARALVTGLMAALGHTEWFEDQALFQLAGHLTGAGPAFLFRFIDALAVAGSDLGLARDQAVRLAVAMVEGAALLAAESNDSPSQLAGRVASPGGTTQAGLAVLDENHAMIDLMKRTIEASRARGLEMAAEAKVRQS